LPTPTAHLRPLQSLPGLNLAKCEPTQTESRVKTSHVEVEVGRGGVTIPCTAEDLRATFSWLLMEMRSVAKVLRPDERDALRKIMSHAGETLTVRDLFPTFERGGEAHKTLRRLRATQFVYPRETGRWGPDEPIAVTPFARVVWDHLGEARIFAPPLSESGLTPDDPRTPPAKPAVVTWDNLLECVRERQKSLASAHGMTTTLDEPENPIVKK
jgi:hypothetical protein